MKTIMAYYEFRIIMNFHDLKYSVGDDFYNLAPHCFCFTMLFLNNVIFLNSLLLLQ